MLTQRVWLVVLALSGLALCAALPALAAPAGPGPAPTPTVDRLAAPPTVANPNQADVGEQIFWLHCQACHGDRAQGLTADWRAQYPPDHQDCWKSRCHGDPPYENGFILPHTVPALVGPGTLNRFATAADLYTFISHVMPFQAPGSLKPDEYWAITAYLLRGHGLPAANLPVTDMTIAQHIPLGASAAVTPTPAAPQAVPGWLPASAGGVVIAVVLAGLGWLAWRRSGRHG